MALESLHMDYKLCFLMLIQLTHVNTVPATYLVICKWNYCCYYYCEWNYFIYCEKIAMALPLINMFYMFRLMHQLIFTLATQWCDIPCRRRRITQVLLVIIEMTVHIYREITY